MHPPAPSCGVYRPCFGTIGGCCGNSMTESFWSSTQIELLNRKTWRTRLELTNAIFEYIDICYDRTSRHSKLDYATPIEHKLRFTAATNSA